MRQFLSRPPQVPDDFRYAVESGPHCHDYRACGKRQTQGLHKVDITLVGNRGWGLCEVSGMNNRVRFWMLFQYLLDNGMETFFRIHPHKF